MFACAAAKAHTHTHTHSVVTYTYIERVMEENQFHEKGVCAQACMGERFVSVCVCVDWIHSGLRVAVVAEWKICSLYRFVSESLYLRKLSFIHIGRHCCSVYVCGSTSSVWCSSLDAGAPNKPKSTKRVRKNTTQHNSLAPYVFSFWPG